MMDLEDMQNELFQLQEDFTAFREQTMARLNYLEDNADPKLRAGLREARMMREIQEYRDAG